MMQSFRAKGEGEDRILLDLELGHFREVKISNLHGGYDHIERFFSTRAESHTHGRDV